MAEKHFKLSLVMMKLFGFSKKEKISVENWQNYMLILFLKCDNGFRKS